MRKQMSLCFLSSLLTGGVMANEQISLSDETDRINYTIGHQIGTDFRRQDVRVNEQMLREGLQHGEFGKTPVIDRAEMQELLVDLKRNISNKMKAESIAKAKKAKAEEKRIRDMGAAYRKEFQGRKGVKTMPSGLEYRVIKPGFGPKPELEDFVTVEYKARTVEDFVYDSSDKKGGPVTFRANGVIPGFTKAIQMMQPGAKWEIVIPPEMAYGRRGPLAHHTIILDLELLSISKTAPQQKPVADAKKTEEK